MDENDIEHRRFCHGSPETGGGSPWLHHVRARGIRPAPASDGQGGAARDAASALLQERRRDGRDRGQGSPLRGHGAPLMFVVDTNIFVYAADGDSPFHQCCRGKIEEWRRLPTPWYSTWGIMYEFLRVITHPRIFHKPWTAPKAWDFVEAILAAPSFGLLAPSERHAEAAAGGGRTSA